MSWKFKNCVQSSLLHRIKDKQKTNNKVHRKKNCRQGSLSTTRPPPRRQQSFRSVLHGPAGVLRSTVRGAVSVGTLKILPTGRRALNCGENRSTDAADVRDTQAGKLNRPGHTERSARKKCATNKVATNSKKKKGAQPTRLPLNSREKEEVQPYRVATNSKTKYI